MMLHSRKLIIIILLSLFKYYLNNEKGSHALSNYADNYYAGNYYADNSLNELP